MSEPITCFIVDDEPLARLRMHQLLDGYREIKIVGEFGNGFDCIEATLKNPPDLLFLDIGLPDHSGLEVVTELAGEMEKLPAIVFATAYDEHAIEAFELNAIDYLLKPVSVDRLKITIDRICGSISTSTGATEDEKLRQWASAQTGNRNKDFLTKIEIRERGGVTFIPLEEIFYFQADGNYLEVHTADRVSLVRLTMAKLEGQLDPDRFIRISRSAIVAVNCVEGIEKKGRYDSWVRLSSGAKIGASRNLEGLEDCLRRS